MKNIITTKMTLLILMLMATSSFAESNRGPLKEMKTIAKSKRVKNRKNRNKRFKKKNKSVFEVSQITPKDVEEALNKTNMAYDPQTIYITGNKNIEAESGDEQGENTIKVGDYFLKVPAAITIETAQEIISKMPLFVKIAINGGVNEQLNLGSVVMLDQDSNYQTVVAQNTSKIKEKIINSPLYKVIFSENEVKRFIVRAIMLELKTVLGFKEEKGFLGWIKSKFRFKTVGEEIAYFAENNENLNKTDLYDKLGILKKDGLSEKTMYLLAATAFYITQGKEFFIDFNNKLLKDMINAITIPLRAKINNGSADLESKINYSAQKEMRELYKNLLKLFNINVSGIKESNSGVFVVESMAYNYLMTALKYTAYGVGVAGATAGLHAGYRGSQYLGDRYYNKNESTKKFKDRMMEDYKALGEGAKNTKNKLVSSAKQAGEALSDPIGSTKRLGSSIKNTTSNIFSRFKNKDEIQNETNKSGAEVIESIGEIEQRLMEEYINNTLSKNLQAEANNEKNKQLEEKKPELIESPKKVEVVTNEEVPEVKTTITKEVSKNSENPLVQEEKIVKIVTENNESKKEPLVIKSESSDKVLTKTDQNKKDLINITKATVNEAGEFLKSTANEAGEKLKTWFFNDKYQTEDYVYTP